MFLFTWLIHYWSVLLWGVPILIACAFIWHFLGWRFTAPVALIGTGIMVFLMGRKIERDNQTKYMQDIKEKRDKAYEKIDSRNTDASDVAERLQHGDF